MVKNEYEKSGYKRNEDKEIYEDKNEYEEFHGKMIRVITREGSHHTLEGVLGGESKTKLFLNDIYYHDCWGHTGTTKGIVSKDKIIFVYLITPKSPKEN